MEQEPPHQKHEEQKQKMKQQTNEETEQKTYQAIMTQEKKHLKNEE